MKYFFTLFLSINLYASELLLTIKNIKPSKGTINIAVFNSPHDFPDRHESAILKLQIPLNGKSTEVTKQITLPHGVVSIATFYDENNNNKLDTNFLGIPKELFGFSNNPKITVGAPHFEECEIHLPQNGIVKHQIRLLKFL
jgi:uncharacterized protein (DUF2141 family)